MGFWKNINDYLILNEISRNELSTATKINLQTINRAIQRDSDPKLIDGLKICKYLKINPEDFLSESINTITRSNNNSDIESEIKLYRKYHKHIQNCELLSESCKNAVFQLAKNLTNVPSK